MTTKQSHAGLSPLDLTFPLSGRESPEGIVWEFGQSWNAQNEPGFAPGQVSLGRQEHDLLVLADLVDEQVMTGAFPLNHHAFLTCDAFEIFLRADADPVYHEFHITPSNSLLQLRFDTAKPPKPLKDCAVETTLFASQTWITDKGWRVFARIPLRPLIGTQGGPLRLSFGRYDHTPGKPAPVISSTSLHTRPNFHKLDEWRLIDFDSLPTALAASSRRVPTRHRS